jgi:hypothetical protein
VTIYYKIIDVPYQENITQDLTTADSVELMLNFDYGIVVTPTNCTAVKLSGSGGSIGSTEFWQITPSGTGSYNVSIFQGYFARTSTLSGTVSTYTPPTSEETYGYEQYDSSNNLVLDSGTPVATLIKIDNISFYLAPTSSTATPGPYYNYALPGVTSQADLDNNYIFNRISDTGFSIFGGRGTFTWEYVSPGQIRAYYEVACTTLSGEGRPCTSFDSETGTFQIYAIGKAL